MKTIVKYLLQKLLGYDNYLFVFGIFTLRRLHNNHHEKEFLYFLNMIPAEGKVLDIGANIGVMTTAIAQKAQKGMVISFEPMPDNIRVLKKIVNHYKLKNVQVIETALGEQKGELTMVLPVMNKLKMQGLSHVKEEGNTDAWNKGVEFTVPVQKLDDIVTLTQLDRLDAIKIDVENYEYYVLKGGEQLLRRHMPFIYCELWKNEKRELCMNYLKGLGYEVKVMVNNQLTDFTTQEDETNFFFIAGKK
jgi:FkbM family methyltransferase